MKKLIAIAFSAALVFAAATSEARVRIKPPQCIVWPSLCA